MKRLASMRIILSEKARHGQFLLSCHGPTLKADTLPAGLQRGKPLYLLRREIYSPDPPLAEQQRHALGVRSLHQR